MAKAQINNTALLDHLPCLCIMKDAELNYIAFNQEAANVVQLKNRDDVLGRSDYDLPWREHADRYLEQDKLSLAGKTCLDILPTTRVDGSKTLLLAKKTPLYSNNKKIIGVVGISLHLSREKYTHLLSLLTASNLNFTEFVSTVNEKEIEFTYGKIAFTKRQAQIVSALLKGFSSGLTAKHLNLSKRTVESYVEIIKEKLECEKKSEIISKAFDYGFIDLMFMKIQ